uniref:Ig-like domain-containing protein n=1 Tax=Anabas testudineus TaxID=64144 RepID=A0A3Q1I9B5_ANATE
HSTHYHITVTVTTDAYTVTTTAILLLSFYLTLLPNPHGLTGALHCEVVHESTGKISSCNNTYKRTPPGTYTITNVYKEDSGKYWCDAGGETRNDSVNITLLHPCCSDGPVILEISALPVMEGEDVTLRCRNKTTSSQTSAGFYKDGVFIISSSTGNMIIHSVSKSDEGLYKCSISGAGESAESRLTVRSKESPNKWLTVQSKTHPLLTEDPFYSTIQEVRTRPYKFMPRG